jgi:tetratricopeptide (TPR) repeat protein
LEVDPHHPNALYEMADVLYAQGRLDEAEKYYLRSLRSDPAMLDAYLGVERIYSSESKYEKSLDLLRKAAKVAPADPTAHYRMASIYRKLGNLREAQLAMKEFERLKTAKDQP